MLKILLSVGGLQFAAMLVLLLRTKGLALLLGPEQFGLMAALDRLVAVFAQTASLSLPYAALRYLSPLWHGHPDAYGELLRRMRNVLLTLVGITLAGAWALAWGAPGWLGREVAADRLLASLALAGLPVVALVPFLQNALASGFSHNRAMLFFLLHAAVFTLASLAGAALWGLHGLFGLYAVVGGTMAFLVLRRVQGARHEGPSPGEGDAGTVEAPEYGRGLAGYLPPRVWRFCLLLLPPAFLAPAVAYAVFYEVLTRHGDVAAGHMQAAIGISLAVRGVLGAASQVFLTPLVNRAGPFEERLERAGRFQKTLFLLVGAVVPPVVLLAALAIRVLYSPEFLPGAPFVALFVVMEVLTLAVGTYQAVLVAMEHIVFYVTQNAVAQLVLWAVAMSAIPTLGIAGAALAGLAAQAVLLVGTLGYLARKHGLRIPVRVWSVAVYVLAVLGGGGWLTARLPGVTPAELAPKALYYLVTTGLLAAFLDRDDWANLRRLARGPAR